MNGFLDALAYICARAVGVAFVYLILKVLFHYVCTPFEIYLILVLQGLAAHSNVIQVIGPEEESRE